MGLLNRFEDLPGFGTTGEPRAACSYVLEGGITSAVAIADLVVSLHLTLSAIPAERRISEELETT
jgi:hypothetical protein